MSPRYVYVLIRQDIRLADQIVQVGHACLEAGFKYQRPNENIHLVIIHVESEAQLLSAVEKIGAQGIQFTVFHEPDDEMGYTAACTEPISPVYRREFRGFPLWESAREVIET